MDVRDAKEWLTAAEAADEKLPGLPLHERSIGRLIADGKIASRPRQRARGRPPREFHWTALPAAARDEYLKRHGVPSEELPDDQVVRTAVKDLRAEARALIVAAFADYRASRSATKTQALKCFCKAFEKRALKLDGWVFASAGAIAPHQIALWECRLRRGESLRDGRGRPSGSGLFETDLQLRNYTVAAIAARPHLGAAHLKRLIATDLGRAIALRTLQHFLRGFRKSAAPELKALTNPDRYRSHHKPGFGIVGGRVERINARWEIDASPADAMCIVDGRERRMKIVGLIDVFTRRAMVLVSDQVRGIATTALLRRAILAWGMPELVKVDNGKEFKNRAVERFFADTGITPSFSRPFTPEQKPHIERFFGTLNRDLFELLPGYVGHSVAERQGIEARRSFAHRFGEDASLAFGVALSPEGLQARIDEWCANVYEQRHHAGLALRPCDLAIAHADDVRRLADERALDALMLEAPDGGGMRLVGKSGIRIGNRFYVAGELGAWPGHRVHCRFDPHELARIVVYNAERTEFLCVAQDRAAMADADLAREAARAQKINAARIRDIREATRKVQRLYPAEGAADRMLLAARHDERASAKSIEDTFTPSPESADAMRRASTPALLMQRRALDALGAAGLPEQPVEATEEERESAQLFFAGEASNSAPVPDRVTQCDGYERPAFLGDEVSLYLWLDAHRDGLDAADRRMLLGFEADEDFRLQLSIHRQQKRVTA